MAPKPSVEFRASRPGGMVLTLKSPAVREEPAELTVAEFVKQVFIPEHVSRKNLSGRIHYQSMLKHVLTPEDVDAAFRNSAKKPNSRLKAAPGWPYIGQLRLNEVRPEDVERLMAAAAWHGYSTQTVKHIRSVISVMFSYAAKARYFAGENPADSVAAPALERKEAHTLSLDQLKQVLQAMQHPEREMTLLAVLTGMTVAEVCGLQWKWVNLTEEWRNVDGEAIPPRTLAVREQWYLGRQEEVSGRNRRRNEPIPLGLIPLLRDLEGRRGVRGSDDFVFVSASGTPVNLRRSALDRLKPIGKAAGVPWLSWQALRRTRAILLGQLGMRLYDEVIGTIRADEPVREPVAVPAWNAAGWTESFWM